MANNPMSLADQLRQYNAWRRGQGIYDSAGPHPGPNPKDLGLLLDTIADRLETLEDFVNQLRNALIDAQDEETDPDVTELLDEVDKFMGYA